MKKYLFRMIPVFIILWGLLSAPFGVSTGLCADQNTASVGYLENVLFENFSGRERVSLIVSQQPVIAPPTIQADKSLLIKLDNLFAPDNMREPLGAGQLLNVTGVRAQQQTGGGKQWVNLRISLKENVPYSIRQEGKTVIIDFNISSVEAKLNAAIAKDTLKFRDARSADAVAEDGEMSRPVRREASRRLTERIISLDFQDADIKSVLRLMAEYGNISIISGDDVKGNVTLSMKNVPWDQALDAILKVQGLSKQQTNDVITVMTLERQKKDIQIKKAADDEMRKAEADSKAKELREQAEKGKLRQILIEAKIVEASEEFVRNLGIQWGVGGAKAVGDYALGAMVGTNPLNSTNAQALSYPGVLGANWTKSGTTDPLTMAAVNFPAQILGPTLGLVFGGANLFIETQLSALETNAQGRVISAPKVVTMDNVKAIIKQGDDVPYVTPPSGNSPATVSFKEAVLSLEVTPKITEEGRISMQIKAKNDTPDYAKRDQLYGNPPIRKNEVESNIVVQDGDTVVIGGVLRSQEDVSVAGVPWVYKIPILGWLFKTESTTRQKRQLMIFITPKILAGSGYIEDECDRKNLDNLGRCRNRK